MVLEEPLPSAYRSVGVITKVRAVYMSVIFSDVEPKEPEGTLVIITLSTNGLGQKGNQKPADEITTLFDGKGF